MLDEAGSEWTHGCWREFSDRVTSRVAYVEVRAALAAANRAGRVADDELIKSRIAFEAIWSRIDVIECEKELVTKAGAVAEKRALRGFDAVHLESALEADTDDTTVLMLTWDNDLARAAYDSGISTIRTTDA